MGRKNFLGQKKIWVKQIFGSRKFLGRKKFLGQKNFLVENFFWVETIFWVESYLLVPEKSWGRVNPTGGWILPLPTENTRVKLCWVVVTLPLWGHMQNFRSLGYLPGWTGGWSYCDYVANLSPINWIRIDWDWAWQYL